jgi:hypothetical protein
MHNSKPVSIPGHPEFPSIAAAARAFGLDHDAVHQRLRGGWSLTRALTTPIGVTRSGVVPTPYTVNGVQYQSAREACAAHGLKRDTVSSRLNYGWSEREAFGLAAPPPVCRHPPQDPPGVLTIMGQRFTW